MEYNPPQLPIQFPAEPDVLLEQAHKAINASRQAQDDLVSRVKPENATFDNVLLPLMHAENVYISEFYVLRHPKDVTTNEKLRESTRQVERLTNDYAVESGMREDVFRLVQAVVDLGEELEGERLRCLQKVHRGYLVQGLALEGEERANFKQVTNRIKELCAECRKNFSDERAGLWLTPQQLAGLPPNNLKQLKKGEGENSESLWLTMKVHDFEPAMKFVKDEEIRKRIFITFENKCNSNAGPVKELYIMRDKAARLLGYANNAARKIVDSFAQSPSFVDEFLNDLQERLRPAGKETHKTLYNLKRAELGKPDCGFYLWDIAYYTRMLIQQKHSLDEVAVSEYFALDPVLDGMFKIFQKLFGISLVKIQLTAEVTNGTTYLLHEDTTAYQVWDGVEPGKDFIGYLYLDLHPRDFKLAHSCHLALHRGYTEIDGSRHYPSSILICNWTKPLPGKPSLLRHRECVSLFHELGHAIHNLVTKTEFAILAKPYHDFVEAPSKMLEHWFWIPEVLRSISTHWSYLNDEYAQTWRAEQGNLAMSTEPPPKTMPDEMISSIIRSRFTTASLFQLRQISLARYDLAVHSPQSHEELQQLDVQKLYNSLRHEITMVDGPDNDYTWGNNHAKFSHLWGKYDAGYYGYILASAISSDMHQAFAKDPLNAVEGTRYRKQVLEPGGSLPEMSLLENFLGRRPNYKAWVDQMGFDARE